MIEHASTLTVGQERQRRTVSKLPRIVVARGPHAVTFSPNGEYAFSDGGNGIQVQRVGDGQKKATMGTKIVPTSLAVSNNGKWIAAGMAMGDVHLWDANTYKQVFVRREDSSDVNGVDFSPDSTRLVAASKSGTATIWEIATRKQVQTLRHGDAVFAAKYSPKGDRIATATRHSVRVYDSNGGRLLVDINVVVTPWYNTGLVWFIDNLLVVSDGKIKQFEASTGLAVAEWPVPDADRFSCIALPKHGEFIACSTGRTVTFLDTVTHIQLSFIQHPQNIHSIALSPDDRFLAIAGEDGKTTINNLSCVTVCMVSCWVVVHINKFLFPIISRRVRSLCLVYNPRSRKQAFGSMTPRSILGSTINLRMQKYY